MVGARAFGARAFGARAFGVAVSAALLATALPTMAVPLPRDVSDIAAPAGLTPATVQTHGEGSRLIVGDSLTVAVAPRLRRRGFSVDAQVGRQFSAAPAIVQSHGADLPRNVVVALGTNGTIRLSQCRAVIRRAGPQRRVFLVTNRVPRSWQRPNNRTLRECDRSVARKRVRRIHWYRASAGHPEWFAADRVHLTAAGQRAFVRLIDGDVDSHGR